MYLYPTKVNKINNFATLQRTVQIQLRQLYQQRIQLYINAEITATLRREIQRSLTYIEGRKFPLSERTISLDSNSERTESSKLCVQRTVNRNVDELCFKPSEG